MSAERIRIFAGEPMGDKLVTALPGIGKTLGDRMKNQGFGKASQVYGQFLILNRDHVLFEAWMKENFGVDRNRALQCSTTLDAYFRNFNE